MGLLDVIIDYTIKDGAFTHISAGLMRTCRKIAKGEVFVLKSIWDNVK
jgi:2-methylaconitate cis-trans-isomerase PrpF